MARTESRRAPGILLALLLALAAAPASAIEWQDLSPEQQSVLAGMEQRWSELPAARQERLAQGAARWQAMTGTEPVLEGTGETLGAVLQQRSATTLTDQEDIDDQG